VFVGEYVFELLTAINPSIKTKLEQEGFTLINVTNYYFILEYIIASLIVAFCAGLTFLICRKFLAVRESLIIVFIFAFCTSLWSVAGRALWMHGPLILCLLIAIYFVTSDKMNPKKASALGFILAFSFIIRPTGMIFFIGFLFYFALTNKKYFYPYLISGLIIFAGFFVLNYSIYGTILSPYYLYYTNILSDSGYPNFFQALAGNLISPGKGLLIFSPVLIFSVLGIYIKLRKKEFTKLDTILLLIFILYYISISLVTKWWDGWSYGPRYIADALPVLIYFLIPYFRYPEFFKSRRIVNFILIVFILISFLIHTKGALSYRVWVEWNGLPQNVDAKPERMWDWKDPPFLR
jgi:hypothetical protein